MIYSVAQYASKTGSLCYCLLKNDILFSHYSMRGQRVGSHWMGGFIGTKNSTSFYLELQYN